MAASMVPLNIVRALVKAVEFVQASGWAPRTLTQQMFLEDFYREKSNLRRFSEKELRAWADTSAEKLNAILKKEGFSLQFDPFGPNEFGVLSILDVLVEWVKEGKAHKAGEYKKYPCVTMQGTVETDGGTVESFRGFMTDRHPHPIALLPTKSGDTVYMTIAKKVVAGFALTETVELLRGAQLMPQRFSHLEFPMVDFEETKKLDWIVGLTTEGGKPDAHIAEAAQQTKFKMNHQGARVKDAVIAQLRLLSARHFEPPPLIIDQPFLLWIERTGVGKPIFYAYLDESIWKDPGSLAM